MSGEQLKQDGSGGKAQTLEPGDLESCLPSNHLPCCNLACKPLTDKGGEEVCDYVVPNFHLLSLFKNQTGLPGGPVIRIWFKQCREHGFGPGRVHMLQGSN